jgi:hypothetical protein
VGKIEVEEVDAHLGRVHYDAMANFTTRPAAADDARAIAEVFSPSLRLLTFLPVLHTVEEDRHFIENVILRESVVTVAESEAGIVSFLARQEEEIRLLYSRPDSIGAGAGSLLLAAAKRSGVAALELWCFQANIARDASTRRAASMRCALPTGGITRRRRRMSAIAGSAAQARALDGMCFRPCRHP